MKNNLKIGNILSKERLFAIATFYAVSFAGTIAIYYGIDQAKVIYIAFSVAFIVPSVVWLFSISPRSSDIDIAAEVKNTEALSIKWMQSYVELHAKRFSATAPQVNIKISSQKIVDDDVVDDMRHYEKTIVNAYG